MHATHTPERWLPIPGYEGYYEVSDAGRVRGINRKILCRNGVVKNLRGRKIHGWHDELGYHCVMLRAPGKDRQWKVHQLVALAFIGPRPEGMDTCHTNDDRSDNRAANLRYDTHSENAKDHVRAGNHYETKRTCCPRGHLLVVPNLRAARLAQGHRICLACHRANAWMRKDPTNRRAHLDAVAMARYQAIMSSVAGPWSTRWR